jgi:hypothetical protein
VRKGIVALAIVFLIAHLPVLPTTLEDIDSINFALGVRHFDVATHQPHPPGYPLFIALGKASTAALFLVGVPAAEPRGLAIWSTIAGTALVFWLLALYRALDGDDRRAGWATAIAVLSPLFWFTALRPLSDMTGLAAAVAAQALIVPTIMGRGSERSFLAGAFLAGLAIGFRSQSFLLTLPLLGLALVMPRTGLRGITRAAAVGACGLGVLAWAVPLVIASGGPDAYAVALGTQAGEDFSGVVMLWNMRTARVAADALLYTFLWPWGHPIAGAVAVAAATLGTARAAWRMPRTLLVLLVAFVPYTVFHLLFHEVVTVRYALPLVVPVAYLVTVALDALPRMVLPAIAAIAGAASLALTLPATVTYGREGSPAFRALRGDPNDSVMFAGGRVIGFHAVTRRAAEWLGSAPDDRVLKAPHGREWLSLIEQWRAAPQTIVWFVADPRRTDLALFDPAARTLHRSYRWGFVEPPFVGGARPGDSDLYAMHQPGWMLDRGWALTPEVAGISARDGWGPHRKPSVAWVRAREEAALLVIGGRNLAPAGDLAARVTLTLAGRPLDTIDVPPGFFFKRIPLPAGSLSGTTGYLPLDAQSRAADGSSREIPVALEQFNLQPDGVPMIGAGEGWQEPEYNPLTSRSWRWTTERATLWVRPIGRDVTLTLSGESPLRYFDAAPHVTFTVGGTRIAEFSPASDFTEDIVLPAGLLGAADGRVVIESDKWFVPAERQGSADKRHLALRIYSYAVR